VTSLATPGSARLASSERAAPFDRGRFLRPIAHRGLHSRKRGLIENSAPAFLAAIDKGYGIECDLQAAKDGTPMVFHDDKLERLFSTRGRLRDLMPATLAALRYRGGTTGILAFCECLGLVAGRVPLLVEVKRNKQPPPQAFLETIALQAKAYAGPLALMSFDRAVLAGLRHLAPEVPQGWIVGRRELPARWWAAPRSPRKDRAIARLLATIPEGIDFLAVDVRILRGARAFLAEKGLALPLFSWTIRTRRERSAAARWADAPIFEGYEA
jgi:glycerophosphoryl diester phosphodiesterase